MSHEKINFNAGPATLPAEVLEEVAVSVKNYKDSGMSVLELPHRGRYFLDIIEESKALVRELCGIDEDYEVLWLHGGGRLQFTMIPMNFLGTGKVAAYIDSGHWASEAIEYSRYYGETLVVTSSKESNYNRLPEWPASISSQSSYLHLTTNNTIFGTQYHSVPPVNVPLVADMSSDIFSCSRNYNRYALFYAAAQKNLGTPGVALTVIHRDMLQRANDDLPPMLSFKAQAKEKSILNTANVSGIYISLLMLRWTKNKGIASIEAENERKANMLYSAIDNSPVFRPHVPDPAHRSKMNICFTATDKEVEKAFIGLCAENNIIGIEGHRSVGGFRVSLYNAVTEHSVALLAQLMNKFGTKS